MSAAGRVKCRCIPVQRSATIVVKQQTTIGGYSAGVVKCANACVEEDVYCPTVVECDLLAGRQPYSSAAIRNRATNHPISNRYRGRKNNVAGLQSGGVETEPGLCVGI